MVTNWTLRTAQELPAISSSGCDANGVINIDEWLRNHCQPVDTVPGWWSTKESYSSLLGWTMIPSISSRDVEIYVKYVSSTGWFHRGWFIVTSFFCRTAGHTCLFLDDSYMLKPPSRAAGHFFLWAFTSACETVRQPGTHSDVTGRMFSIRGDYPKTAFIQETCWKVTLCFRQLIVCFYHSFGTLRNGEKHGDTT